MTAAGRRKKGRIMMNKFMKKIAIAFAAATMMIAGASMMASANETKYVANDIGVNVRQAASADSQRLGGLYMGDAVDVIAVNNGWAMINYNGRTAYVINDALSYTKPYVPSGVNNTYTWIKETNSSNSSRIQAARGYMSHDNNTFTVNVASGYLALRYSAVTDPANEIGRLYSGQMVQVQQYGSQFDYVYVPALNAYGYVNNDYLI